MVCDRGSCISLKIPGSPRSRPPPSERGKVVDFFTDSQTKHLDRWEEAGDVRFLFGFEAHDCLKARADELPAEAYSFLERPPQYQIKTVPR